MPVFWVIIIENYTGITKAETTPNMDAVSSVKLWNGKFSKDVLGLSITLISYDWIASLLYSN
jgi:hypothetical protein